MLKDMITGGLGFVGVGLISYGAYMIKPAAGFIVAGVALLAFSFLASRAIAFNKYQGKK